jgi:transcription elongation factor Elf1
MGAGANGDGVIRFRLPVPHTPIEVRVPSTCPFCGAVGTTVPQTTVKGDAVSLMWYCRTCEHDWPVTRGEQIPSAPRSSGGRE